VQERIKQPLPFRGRYNLLELEGREEAPPTAPGSTRVQKRHVRAPNSNRLRKAPKNSFRRQVVLTFRSSPSRGDAARRRWGRRNRPPHDDPASFSGPARLPRPPPPAAPAGPAHRRPPARKSTRPSGERGP
jgi:hypothetical protein